MPLNLPIDPRAIAFEAIDKRVKFDPVISRVIKTFEGIPFELTPESAAKMPMMVIGCKPGGIATASPSTHAAIVQIGFDYMLPGTDHRDILNFYGALESAIDPYGDISWLRDPIAATGRAVLLSEPAFIQQGFNVVPLPAFNALGGTAIVQVSIKIKPSRC